MGHLVGYFPVLKVCAAALSLLLVAVLAPQVHLFCTTLLVLIFVLYLTNMLPASLLFCSTCGRQVVLSCHTWSL